MDHLLTGLLASCRVTERPVDSDLIIRAYEFARIAHTGQKRLSGQDFITHPVQVATYLALWNLDTTTIAAGLLHDTIEDGGARSSDIVAEFGQDIATLVDGVTNISKIRLKGSVNEEFVENLRKMLLVMAKDMRVVMVKLADRLHNMETLKYLPLNRQKQNAIETLEIFAPLAERLGMGKLKGDMEDLAFPYVYPAEYNHLVSQTKKLFIESDKIAAQLKKELLILFNADLPQAEINTRRKHLYSLYRKLARPDISGDLSKIHDIVAARVIVDSVEQCYLALGLIHHKYRPVPFLGVSDFIANPKPNGYRSLHTKVFGPQGKIVELQIRTREMHAEAEMGIAAHFHMSELKSANRLTSEDVEKGQFFAPKNKLVWVKQLTAWQKEMTDNKEYLNVLKIDALNHRIFVFSPIGDVYELPINATPIDFAYAVHTKLGHQAIGAKVNTKMVQLNYQLQSGDVVEIMVDRKKNKPNSDWLNFVITHTARHSISKSLKLS